MDEDDAGMAAAAGMAAVAAAAIARKALVRGWTRKTGRVPDGALDSSWGEAITWAVVSGVVVGVTRIVAERGVATALGARTGSVAGSIPAEGLGDAGGPSRA